MKVLVIGSGAKEHAVTWAFSKSRRISALYAAPGNAGTGEIAENIEGIDITDPAQVLRTCADRGIDFVFCGSEWSQAAGVVDKLRAEGFAVLGASKEAARIETDRKFANAFMKRHSIPTTESEHIDSEKRLREYLESHPGRVVLKKNGLARYGRTFESESREELLDFGSTVLKEDTLLAEPFVDGYNLSILSLVDGKNYLPLPLASDYSKARDNEEGAITNGMGAVCPVPIISGEEHRNILDNIVEKTLHGLKKEGLTYRGILFISLIISDKRPLVTSFHVRFGDPEAQAIIPLITSDFGNLMEAVYEQQLDTFSLCLSRNSSVGVVIAGEGYPYKNGKDIPVQIENVFPERDILIFHGATYTRNRSQEVFTNGRRSFTVVGLGDNIVEANSRAYKGTRRIQFEGAWTRGDIGKNFFSP
ncbi:MAG: phosphoribosylamine--glycine ligase [Spirochaetaceae bacterium]